GRRSSWFLGGAVARGGAARRGGRRPRGRPARAGAVRLRPAATSAAPPLLDRAAPRRHLRPLRAAEAAHRGARGLPL
ncbi:MAG: hypothetical protein AVDCRST_MAG08-1280, partial [uncultured Acetobacteraceae bacterium]